MSESSLNNGRRKFRFDEMATIVNDRVDDPSQANVDHYVGLEHLDSDSLTIRRWGSPSDVEATKLRFRAGDIIFGRRADNSIRLDATLEQDQSRDAFYPAVLSGWVVVIDVELDYLCFSLILLSHLLDRGRKHLAWMTPFCPKVDQHRLV